MKTLNASFFGIESSMSNNTLMTILWIVEAVICVLLVAVMIYVLHRKKPGEMQKEVPMPAPAEPVQEPQEEPVPAALVPVPAPPVIAEESFEGVLRYNKSFTAKYIQSGDEVKNWYTALKNEMLSYKKVKARTSWKRETFRLGREAVARLAYRGNTLCVYFPLNAADYTGSKYKVEDVSESAAYADTPCMYRLKNGRRARYAMELFAAVMERMGGVRTERIAEDYYLPYEGVVELIEKGLIKRVVKSKAEEAAFLRPAEAAASEAAPEAVPEEPVEKPLEEPAEQVAEEVAEEVAATAEPVEEATAEPAEENN